MIRLADDHMLVEDTEIVSEKVEEMKEWYGKEKSYSECWKDKGHEMSIVIKGQIINVLRWSNSVPLP